MSDIDLLGPPLVLMAVAGVIVLGDLVLRPRGWLAPVSLLGLAGSALWTGLIIARDQQGAAFHDMLVVDDFTLFFNFLFAGVAALVVLASIDYVFRFGRRQAEYYALLLTATAGMMLMASTVDLIAIFLALELTSICLYILAGYLRDVPSSEAGLKYLLFGAISSAVTLYGMALLFGLAGSTSLASVAQVVATATDDIRPALVLAVTMLAVGFAFKLAAVPAQMWVPDVYEGSPTPVAAYLAVASKAAGFAVVMRVFFEGLGGDFISSDWANLFAVLAAMSMTVGNIIAIVQTNIKRMLGYSSIAQAGYFMVGLAAVSAQDGGLTMGASGVIFFLAAYALTNLGAFIAVIAISHRVGSDLIADYAGMWRRAPLLSLALTFCLISLTGIPPTAGFMAKVYIFDAAVKSDLAWLAIVAVINSMVSAYYYLAVVRQMHLAPPVSEERVTPGAGLALALAVATAGVLVVGIVPAPLIAAAEQAARVFTV